MNFHTVFMLDKEARYGDPMVGTSAGPTWTGVRDIDFRPGAINLEPWCNNDIQGSDIQSLAGMRLAVLIGSVELARSRLSSLLYSIGLRWQWTHTAAGSNN
ncbi:hypothetical protein ETB97_002438 [Aspergillus alliaceus]|uniref:Uncharacterized protein n=1 Tax=Petromyces alliaceus TaxID=209559 RepID=A0A8H6A4K1_PETAA|nr:hypothetical protein ETB97_002438 [Aspergillus burnettii]